jgi:nucleotide-binding universal stress UspA family protein
MGKHVSEYARVLVPVSGGRADAHALKIVSRLIEPKMAEVTAVYVIEVAQSLPLDAELPEEIDRGESALEKAQNAARTFCGSRADFFTTDLLQARSAGAAIVDEALDRHCDLIVLSSSCRCVHGKRHVSDTVSYVMKNAPCEVMVLNAPTDSLECEA